jgi:2-methylcitrate dehydratase PrpD
MSESGATGRLASYVAALEYEDLPEAVVSQAKVAIRDSLGCLLGGSTLVAGQQMSAKFLSMAAEGQATVAGSRRRAPSPMAGYVNAQLTNLLDFDDTLVELGSGHPGATIIPAALAVGEEGGASGKDLIVAVVAGYDVHSRVGAAGKPTFARSLQVRGHATWQTFGAVAAAARSLGLS